MCVVAHLLSIKRKYLNQNEFHKHLLCGTRGIGGQIKTSCIKVSMSTWREQEQQYLRTPSLSLSSGLSSSSSSSSSGVWAKTSRSRSMSSCNSKLGWSSNDILVLSPGQEALLCEGGELLPFRRFDFEASPRLFRSRPDQRR